MSDPPPAGQERSFPVARHDTTGSVRVRAAADATPRKVLAAYLDKIDQQEPPAGLILEELDPQLEGGADWVQCSPKKPVPDQRKLRAVLQQAVGGEPASDTRASLSSAACPAAATL